MVVHWFVRWRRLARIVRDAVPATTTAPLPVRLSSATIEPGVFGLFRSVLVLPDGITSRLTQQEFEAVLAHEWSHVRRRDNLTAAVHMLVQAVFWFYPAVWWIWTEIGGRARTRLRRSGAG